MLPERSPQVIYKSVSDGAVLFHTTEEVYFGLNSVGGKIWELLPPECRTLEELVARLRIEYPDVEESTLRQDVGELLEELQAHGLLQSAGETDDASAAQARDA